MRLGLLGIFISAVSAFGGPAGDYRLHLYFGDTAPFVDTMHIERDAQGTPSGTMHVPNDFDGVLENITETESELLFDLFVPKNATRPVDLVFRYQAFVLDPGNLSGFVTLSKSDGKPVEGAPYIGSFVAFSTASNPSGRTPR